MMQPDPVLADLFADERSRIALDPGAFLLGGFAESDAPDLLAAIRAIESSAPFRHLETPGGRRMSVAMTNCGDLGWVSDRTGYRYTAQDPLSGKVWPAMPHLFRDLARKAAEAAGFDGFSPDACLVNRYAPGSRLSLHQDRDEGNLEAPIVSISLGVSAIFLWGGDHRSDLPARHLVHHGDVVVWGGPSRMRFHGIDVLKPGSHPATGVLRFNLTFRRARP